MSTELVIFTANHRTATLAQREELSLSSQAGLVNQLKELAHGVVAVETCNRIELILSVTDSSAVAELERRLTQFFPSNSWSSFSRLVGDSAIRHLFRVVSGLESQVIGEAQIAGQVKKAYYNALEAKQTDTLINRAFHQAFNVSKLVRTKSQIGRGSVSIASLGAKLCEQIVGSISQRRVLVIGAGDLAELTLKHLSQRGLKELSVVNRTAEKSFELAKKFGGRSFSWDKLKSEIADACQSPADERL